jgi:tRNA (cmo5U34)-methyltransferase
MKQTHTNLFDQKKAEQYDIIARKAVFAYDQLFVMITAQIQNYVSETASVLVVGCGTGTELVTFAETNPSWRVTGIDPSEEMIWISRRKIEHAKLTNRVSIYQGFIDNMPEDKLFDAATLIYVIRFIADDYGKLLLLTNIAKRLKPGAPIIIVDQCGDRQDPLYQTQLLSWKQYMMNQGLSPELAETIIIQSAEKSLVTENKIHNLLQEAGFNSIYNFYNVFIHAGRIAYKNT